MNIHVSQSFRRKNEKKKKKKKKKMIDVLR